MLTAHWKYSDGLATVKKARVAESCGWAGKGPERSRELPGRGLSYPPLATGTMLNAASSFGQNLIFKKYNNLKTVRSAPECEAFVISYAHLFETGWSAPQGGHCPSLKQSVALPNATNGEPIFLTTVWSLLECYKQTPKTIRSAPECHKCIKTVRNVSQNQFFEESRDIHPLAFKKWTLNI